LASFVKSAAADGSFPIRTLKISTGMRQQGSSKSESQGKGESKNFGKNSNGSAHEINIFQ
jgi:hypothetical protein